MAETSPGGIAFDTTVPVTQASADAAAVGVAAAAARRDHRHGMPVLGVSGTAAAPNPYLASDVTTGLFDKAVGDLGFAASGLQVANLTKTALNLDDLLAITGALTLTALATPGAPTVTPQGTSGATTYTYRVVATVGGRTTDAGATGSTATGNATLSGSNFNRITWSDITGATGYDIYRTVGGATQGKIGATARGVLTLDDTGLAGDAATAPTTNGTGSIALPKTSALGIYTNKVAEIGWTGLTLLDTGFFYSEAYNSLNLLIDGVLGFKFQTGGFMETWGVAGILGWAAIAHNGTYAAPTPIVNGDLLNVISAQGQTTTTPGVFATGGQLMWEAIQNFSAGNAGTKLRVRTTPSGSASVRDVWTFDHDGGLLAALTTSYARLPQAILTNNGAEPSATADQARLYGVDIAADRATLGIATEETVVTETVISDRTLAVRINGVPYRICFKS